MKILAKSLLVAFVIAVLTAFIGFYFGEHVVGEGQAQQLQIAIVAFQSAIIFVPTFIGCVVIGFWQSNS